MSDKRPKWHETNVGCAVAILIVLLAINLPSIVHAIWGTKPNRRMDAIEQRLDALEEKHHVEHKGHLAPGP